MATKLRILLDECLDGELIEMVRALDGVYTKIEAIDANHALGNSAVKDPQVIAYATKHKLITVTVEYGIDQRKYVICTHPGIIVIHTSGRNPKVQFEAYKRFMQSGVRTICKHAVVKLSEDGYTVVDKRGGEPSYFPW